MSKQKNRWRWGSNPGRPSTSRRNAATRSNNKFLGVPEPLESRALMAISSSTGAFVVNAVEGQAMSPQQVALFTINDSATDQTGRLTASIDWGDGNFSPGTISFLNGASGASNYKVTGNNPSSYAEDKDYTVKVMLNEYTDNTKLVLLGAQQTVIDTAAVTDAPLVAGPIVALTPTEGVPLTNVKLATFTDTDPGGKLGEYTIVSIDWGDGTVDVAPVNGTAGTVTQPGGAGNPFEVHGTHTYTAPGKYAMSIVVRDVEDIHSPLSGTRAQVTIASTVATPNVTVADAPLTGTPAVFNATEGTAASGPVAGFTDADPNAQTSDFVATIDWGDGSPIDNGAMITKDGKGGFTVNGGHLYKDNTGIGPIKVTVYDIEPASPGGPPRLITDPTDAKVVINSTANVAAAAIVVTGTSYNSVEGIPATTPLAPSGFSGLDPNTQGNWVGTYGADGFWIPNDAKNLPAYATVTQGGTTPFTWTFPTSDVRALRLSTDPGNPNDRAASAWYTTGAPETFKIQITDGKTHQVGIYLLDWDTFARTETVELLDAGNNVISTQNISNFHNGVYALFQVSGTETIRVTNTGPTNAVVSGLFFNNTIGTTTGGATFIGSDSATKGN